MSFLSQLNTQLQFQEFVSLKTLVVGKQFSIQTFSNLNTKWGEKIVVQCQEFRTVLPQRFTERFSAEVLEELNESIKSGKKIFLVSRGPVGKTTNIEFIEEEK